MIYIATLLVTIILSYFGEHVFINWKGIKNKKNKFVRILISMIPFFLIMAFRWNLGFDAVYGYGHYSSGYRWAAVGINKYNYTVGFFKFFEILAKLNIPIFWCYFIITIIYFAAICIFIYKLNLNMIWASITLFGVDMLIFSFSAIRQSLSLAIVMLALAIYFSNYKYRAEITLLLLALASTIHLTVLCYILLILGDLLIGNSIIKSKKRIILLVFIGIILLPIIYSITHKVMNYTNYANSTTVFELKFTEYYVVFFTFILWTAYKYKKQITKINKKYIIIIEAFILLFFLSLTSAAIYNVDRIFQLFTPLYLIYIPTLWKVIPKGKKRNIIMGIIILLLVWNIKQYFIPGNKDYEAYSHYRSVFENWNYYTHLK